MDKLAEAALKLVPEYLSFTVSFAYAPATTMRRHSGKDTVEPVLVSFVVVSVVLSWLISIVSFTLLLDPEQQKHASSVLQLAFAKYTRLTSSPFVIPLLLVMLVCVLAVVLHVIAAGYHRLLNLRRSRCLSQGTDDDFRLGGSIWDTINAGFGFAVLYTPAVALDMAIGTSLYFKSPITTQLIMFSVGVVVEVGLLFFYLPSALSGTHRETSFSQALLAVSVAVGVVSTALHMASLV